MNKKDYNLFNLAKSIANTSDHHFKVGAVLTYKHKPLRFASNSATKCDPIQAKLDFEKYGSYCEGKLHAESAVLIPYIKRRIDISGAEIYIYRCMRNGKSGLARPCSSCMKLIKMCKIKKIHYSTYDGFATETLKYGEKKDE